MSGAETAAMLATRIVERYYREQVAVAVAELHGSTITGSSWQHVLAQLERVYELASIAAVVVDDYQRPGLDREWVRERMMHAGRPARTQAVAA